MNNVYLVKTQKVLVLCHNIDAWLQLTKSSFETLQFELKKLENLPDLATLLSEENPDLILLDMLNSAELTRQTCLTLRQLTTVPLIMLLTKNEQANFLAFLEAGANDFISKPFEAKELLESLEKVLKQNRFKPTNIKLIWNSWIIDCKTGEVKLAGETQAVTSLEYRLLCYLLSNPARLLTSNQILVAVWGMEYKNATAYVRTYIERLRNKFGPALNIQNVPGVGYILQQSGLD